MGGCGVGAVVESWPSGRMLGVATSSAIACDKKQTLSNVPEIMSIFNNGWFFTACLSQFYNAALS